MSYRHAALQQYQSSGAASAAHAASPYQLVEMLLNGALDRLSQARGHMLRSNLLLKAEAIRKAYAIIEYLRLSLDEQAGGELARNLSGLYDYMMRRLTQANAENDPVRLDEVTALLRDIRTAWDEIPTRYRH